MFTGPIPLITCLYQLRISIHSFELKSIAVEMQLYCISMYSQQWLPEANLLSHEIALSWTCRLHIDRVTEKAGHLVTLDPRVTLVGLVGVEILVIPVYQDCVELQEIQDRPD